MNKLIAIGFMLSLLTGCAGIDEGLVNRTRGIKISDHLPPLKYCRERGPIYAQSEDAGDNLLDIVKEVRYKFQNEARNKGGNYARIETNNTTTYKRSTIVVLSGTSYLCKFKTAERTSRR